MAAAAPEPVPQTVHRKIQVGLNFLPMAMGKYTYWDSFTSTATSEAYFAYGLGLSAGYEVLPGLVVGIAPQAIYNVQPKPIEGLATKAAQERDFLARVAYEYRPIDGIAVYAELLPGYSQLIPSDDTGTAAGFVLAFGAGCAVDMTDRFFLSLGGGYQVGFQSQEKEAHKLELRTKYVRVAMGGGVRF